MTRKELNCFYDELFSTGSYRTPTNRPGWLLDRLLGHSDNWYYTRMALILFLGCLRAYVNRFGVYTWASRALMIQRLIEGCGGTITITGARNIADLGEAPVVYACNHMSLIDTMLVPLFLLRQNLPAVVVKQGLFHYPFFGKVMNKIQAIGLERRNARDDLKTVLIKGEQALKQGRSVLIFPQSTRNTIFDPDDFNSLGVKLARRAKVPIVPIALKTDFQQNGKRLKDCGPIDRSLPLFFAFGEPLNVEGNGRETHAKIVQFIQDNTDKWRT